MAIADMAGALSPVTALALVGVAGVGAQWLAWRFRMPAIVLMLAAGLLLGPLTGIFVPERDIGALTAPLVSLAVAVILFEGGLTLNFRKLADARPAVRRLVYIGAPLGWVLSSLALSWAAGLSWASSIVFGGIMIVTGPTVIGPLLRQAKLVQRPAQILQWEGIVNDPIGALVAVLALEIVLVRQTGLTAQEATVTLVAGIGLALLIGLLAGRLLVVAFARGWVPEYIKVPLLFVSVVAVFAGADALLHESGLLAVTVMGLVIANADLPSYTELHRFKEQVTVLLVSGVFIVLAAGVTLEALSSLTWRAALFIALVILVVRPATVLLSLLGTALPMRERLLIALTGPRGVVLVAVAGIFADRLVGEGIADGAQIAPLAFVLVLATVVLHGFTLKPLAKALGLTSGDAPGLLIIGGSQFAADLGTALQKAEVEVLVTDPNHSRLRAPRHAGLPVWYGDVLGEAAEHGVEFLAYNAVLTASYNDAYNTLAATDLAPEFGRQAIWQLARDKENAPRHALKSALGGQSLAGARTLDQFHDMLAEGWIFRTTRLTEEYDLAAWQAARPGAVPLAVVDKGVVSFVDEENGVPDRPDVIIVSLLPPELAAQLAAAAKKAEAASAQTEGSAAPVAAAAAPAR